MTTPPYSMEPRMTPSRWPFVVWMLGWPLAGSLQDYMDFLRGERFSQDVEAGGALIGLLIWVVVGWLLWRKPHIRRAGE
jgi:hypothetical protein